MKLPSYNFGLKLLVQSNIFKRKNVITEVSILNKNKLRNFKLNEKNRYYRVECIQ